VKPLPTSIKEKETHWPEMPWVSFTKEKEERVRIWRVTSSPLLQTKTLRATGIFKSASSCCQFVRVEHGMSMSFEGSLIGLVCIKVELLKMIQSLWVIDRASLSHRETAA